jgi:hypothetical protein
LKSQSNLTNFRSWERPSVQKLLSARTHCGRIRVSFTSRLVHPTAARGTCDLRRVFHRIGELGNPHVCSRFDLDSRVSYQVAKTLTFTVIPAEAGIQVPQWPFLRLDWIPAFAGMTR